MTPREAIDQAKNTLVDDRELTSILNRTGKVRVPVMLEISTEPLPTDYVPTNDPGLFVTFTIEETALGNRLMAEFQGYKEFAA